MKKLLMIADDLATAERQLEKVKVFAPEQVHTVAIHQGESPGNLETDLKDLGQQVIPDADNSSEVIVASQSKDLLHRLGELVEQKAPELIVIASEDLSDAIDITLYKEVLRKTQAALLICTDRPWKEHPHIMASIDLGDEDEVRMDLNKTVLFTARTLKETLEGSLSAVSVISMKAITKELDLIEPAEVVIKHGPERLEKLKEFLSCHGAEDCKSKISAGSPSQQIADAARQMKADLTVMGNVGRKGLQGFVLGNTAEKTLTNVRGDLLVVRTVESK